MNFGVISYVLRYILCCEGVLMLLPAATALIYGEKSGFCFVICMVLCLLLGFPFTLRRPKNSEMRARDGFVAVALGWIVISVIGAIPFVISGSIPSPVDALFEIVSGFTTTGASILTDIESLPKCILMWRSFSHWIGGMGVLVFILIVLPSRGGSHMNLMRAESPGPSVDKLAPKVQTTAKILYGIYIAMTIIQIILLICSGMPVFDSITTSFGTAGTGGFGIRNDSIAGYSALSQSIVTVFMILFGVNFSAYHLILCRKFKRAFCMEEIVTYFAILGTSIAVIAINTYGIFGNLAESVHHAAFQVGSIMTTTGFVTADFNLWPPLSKAILVTLMFIGACAGSTGGGVKVSRVIILLKSIKKEFHSYLHPNSVKTAKMDGKTIGHDVVRSVNVYMAAYVVIFVLSVLVISIEGKDMVTNFTAVAATINNIGPGLEIVGPTGNFSSFSVLSKLVMIFDMLAGRLELFPMLMLFYPKTWKKF